MKTKPDIVFLFKSKPFFFILFPVFFVFHGFVENYRAVPLNDALLLLLKYIIASLVFFFIGRLLFKETGRAAVFSFCIMAFDFFFGDTKDFLKNISGDSFFAHYAFLIPFALILLAFLFRILKKSKKPLGKANAYFNILFTILILTDIFLLVQKPPQQGAVFSKEKFFAQCSSCTKPDIYFLVFDEYSSSTALKETWNYDNGDLDSFLTKKGFKCLLNSKSNYNFTPFSIASILNMNFLNVPNPRACTIQDYKNCFESINSNAVCSILDSMGYTISNYSIFDLQKISSPVTDAFLPLKTKLITSQTFSERVKKDLLYHILTGKFEIGWLSNYFFYTTFRNNQKIINATLYAAQSESIAPKFVYSHIEMPHHPFYFDNLGRRKNSADLAKTDISSYLEYLPKTNEVIKEIVTAVFAHSKRPLAIVLMGDHGFRENQKKSFQFQNLNAVYLSSKDYSGFYDDLSAVNEFRVLFNNLFSSSLPLQKDSTVFLQDKN